MKNLTIQLSIIKNKPVVIMSILPVINSVSCMMFVYSYKNNTRTEAPSLDDCSTEKRKK